MVFFPNSHLLLLLLLLFQIISERNCLGFSAYIFQGISFSLALLSGTFGNQLLDEWHTRSLKSKIVGIDDASTGRKEYLRRFIIFRCNQLKTLPPLGKLESLRHLKIHKLYSVKPIDLEVLGISDDGQECGTAAAPELISFPKLKELEVSFMGWENWVMRRGNIIPSCLVSED
ncbi:hypothetical protein GIB67_004212 [Kingdonia uniflora]|uniref:Uncharacterized protein n=1 Tax=Kingdonia uniflora TaxID=39325 RepID=A0A7J7P0Y4_9MAGN|nr:hypothetical protein GIB67_004212 [Kingdonia uniflora]